MMVLASLYEPPMFSEAFSKGSDGSPYVEQATRAREAINHKPGRTIVELLDGVRFPFHCKCLLAMLNEGAGKTKGFFALKHPYE